MPASSGPASSSEPRADMASDPDHTAWQRAVLGQSGARVILEERDHRVIVRKISTDSRGAAQQDKQERAATWSSHVSIPRVLDPWDGHSFTMEYVAGEPLGEFLRFASLAECSEVVGALTGFIQDNWGTNHDPALQAALSEKVAELRTRIRPGEDLAHRALAALDRSIPGLVIPGGENHGDLSFENVIISPGTPHAWLIDFLDSPLDSPLIDVGRVLIDAEHGWWMSARRATAAEMLGGRALGTAMRDLCNRQDVSADAIAAFKLLAAARILPYSRNPFRIAVLHDVFLTEIPRLTPEASR